MELLKPFPNIFLHIIFLTPNFNIILVHPMTGLCGICLWFCVCVHLAQTTSGKNHIFKSKPNYSETLVVNWEPLWSPKRHLSMSGKSFGCHNWGNATGSY